jgi:hypothetical protein
MLEEGAEAHTIVVMVAQAVLAVVELVVAECLLAAQILVAEEDQVALLELLTLVLMAVQE